MGSQTVHSIFPTKFIQYIPFPLILYSLVLFLCCYPLSHLGHAWIADYGDPDKADEFDYIFKYSPLHNIPEFEPETVNRMHCEIPREHQYPATLLTTGDHDDRVSPLHSLKFYAELRHTLKKLVFISSSLKFAIQSGLLIMNIRLL